jgi:hypothetical protein
MIIAGIPISIPGTTQLIKVEIVGFTPLERAVPQPRPR